MTRTASSVGVEVEIAGEVLRVAVRDDGCGGADFTGGTGLVGLKDHVEAASAASVALFAVVPLTIVPDPCL
jgi:signal transduction histidine kinase